MQTHQHDQPDAEPVPPTQAARQPHQGEPDTDIAPDIGTDSVAVQNEVDTAVDSEPPFDSGSATQTHHQTVSVRPTTVETTAPPRTDGASDIPPVNAASIFALHRSPMVQVPQPVSASSPAPPAPEIPITAEEQRPTTVMGHGEQSAPTRGDHSALVSGIQEALPSKVHARQVTEGPSESDSNQHIETRLQPLTQRAQWSTSELAALRDPIHQGQSPQPGTTEHDQSRPVESARITARDFIPPSNGQPTTNRKPATEGAGDQSRGTPPRLDGVASSGKQSNEVMPAAARAAQVEMLVRLERATGQAIHDRPVQQITSLASNPTIPGAQPQSLASTAGHGLFNLASAEVFAPQTSSQDSTSAPQIVRGVSALLNQRGGVMNMRLDPPELGSLRIQMTIVSGNVTAEFQPSSQQAHALLEKSMPMLRTALEAQGLTVDRLSVHVAHAAAQNANAQFWRDDANHTGHSHNHRSSHDAAQGESRGRGEQQSADHRQRFQNDAAFEEFFGSSRTLTTPN